MGVNSLSLRRRAILRDVGRPHRCFFEPTTNQPWIDPVATAKIIRYSGFTRVATWRNRRYALPAGMRYEMASNTVLPLSKAKRGAQSDSKSAKLPQSSVRAASLQELKTEARRSHTPKQFRELLEHLRAFIPFQKFIGLWGYPSRTTRRVLDQSSVSRMAW